MRNMSCALTTQQVLDRAKDITRRLGWLNVQPGQLLCLCVKCMGLKPGEEIDRLCVVRVKSVRRERLCDITPDDVRREGFPDMSPFGFVWMFCRHMGSVPSTVVTRIEWEYLPGGRFRTWK